MNHKILHDALLLIGPSNCSDGDVKLVGEKNDIEGQVEICYNGVWGTVCNYGWDEVDANVVCQQLGFNNQRALTTNDSRFGDGEGPILLENVRCNQQHSNLSQCVDFRFTGTSRDCKHTAGVICSDENIAITTSTKQLPATTSFYIITNNKLISTTLVATLGAVGTLCIVIVTVVVTTGSIALLRLREKKANR